MTSGLTEKTGHYVLGLMEGRELQAFEAEIASDPVVAAAVGKLQAHFQRLDNTVVPREPSPDLWQRIEAALEEPAAKEAAPILPFRQARPRRWTPYAVAASLVLALGVGYLAGGTSGTEDKPVVIAVLASESDATPGAIVEAFADDSLRLVALEQFEVPAGQILEVWTLPDAQTGPVSLGTFADPAEVRLFGPDLPSPKIGQLYEITLEPAPGSPTGRPTGPILVKGYAKAPI